MGFRIEAQGLEIEIGVSPVNGVYIHEEIIPRMLDQLVQDIRQNAEVRSPVIVDRNTSVVLDGMHRVAALKELGCRYLPACLVDYRSPVIQVGCWYRVIRDWVSDSRLLEIFRSLGLGIELSSLESALKELEARKATAALFTARNCYLIRVPNTDILESYRWVKRFESAAEAQGLHIGYEIEHDAEWQVRSGKCPAALLVPRTTKEEVVRTALAGTVFPPKTTRHTLPARPVNVNVPLSWLKGDQPLEEVDRLLVEYLSGKKLLRLSKGSYYDGRRYEEELLVFR
ncbi:MAG: ParB N-terminal domain-containing protein [Candidatus Hadarchaeum sp.]|uniref:ParB N-terminal domain-containing protein n=1 Tax=Candidatus Hadarchaeum sp. TaxID=2883567 RepID=UPI003D14AB9C